MYDKEQDPNLQAPQEANTTKHVNFLDLESGETEADTSSGSDTQNDSPTKRAWEEMREDQKKQQNGD